MRLYEKNCPFCEFKFLTYDQAKEFCNDSCRAKKIILERRSKKPKKIRNCKHCGEPCKISFCNSQCEILFRRCKCISQSNKDSAEKFLKEKKPRDYEKIKRFLLKQQTHESTGWEKKFNTVRG